jgi:proteasome lid subunit RPN8/RPN11
MNLLILTSVQWNQMQDQVATAAPIEACGLLAGTQNKVDIVIPVPNSLNSPVRYRFAPADHLAAFNQVERAGLDILAIYHSHPLGPPFPSHTDIEEAFYDVVYIIWSPENAKWQANGFWISEGRYNAVTLKVDM